MNFNCRCLAINLFWTPGYIQVAAPSSINCLLFMLLLDSVNTDWVAEVSELDARPLEWMYLHKVSGQFPRLTHGQ